MQHFSYGKISNKQINLSKHKPLLALSIQKQSQTGKIFVLYAGQAWYFI